MEHKKHHNGRVRGKFLAVPPVIDLNSVKKDELLSDMFDKKSANHIEPIKHTPVKISKLERAALPALVVAAVFVGWSIAFNLFFYKTKIDIRDEIRFSLGNLMQVFVKSSYYLKDDFKALSDGPSLNLSASVGFLGDKIADLAELGSQKTVSAIESIR